MVFILLRAFFLLHKNWKSAQKCINSSKFFSSFYTWGNQNFLTSFSIFFSNEALNSTSFQLLSAPKKMVKKWKHSKQQQKNAFFATLCIILSELQNTIPNEGKATGNDVSNNLVFFLFFFEYLEGFYEHFCKN